jgi:TRAP-type transport system small permease protein
MTSSAQTWLSKICAALAAAALFAIMALTFFDVSGRKLMSTSIPGSLELTEMLMVVVIFAALPLVSLRGEHVVFDSLDGVLPTAIKRVQRVAVHAVCALSLLGLAYLMWKSGGQFAESGETSAQLKIARAPFVYAMSMACAITALIHAALIPAALRNEPVDTEGGAL